MNISLLKKPISVRVIPVQPHCFAFGGFEYQMLDAINSVKSHSIDIKPLDFWSREADFDILHFWGLTLEHYNTVRWAKLANKKTIISILTSYPSWINYLKSYISTEMRFKKKILDNVDIITVVNQGQKDYLTNLLNISHKKIHIIPNIINDIYFHPEQTKKIDGDFYHKKDYIISTGNICKRKNQLLLVEACKASNTPLILVGKTLTGEENYAKKIESFIEKNGRVQWIKGLKQNSPELVSAYQNSIGFALPSDSETQPISALEAVALGKPLILANKPYAKQVHYQNAYLVNTKKISSILKAIDALKTEPAKYITPKENILNLSKNKIGAKYTEIYMDLINKDKK